MFWFFFSLTMFMNNCCYHLLMLLLQFLLLLLLLVFSLKLNSVEFYFVFVFFSVRFLLTFELEQRLTKYNIINYASPPIFLLLLSLSHS